MVKCKICLEEAGESKDYQHLHFHLLYKHGMTSRHYKTMYPAAKIVSAKFRQKQRDLMIEKRKRIKDLAKRQSRWRLKKYHDITEMYRNIEPTIDNIETITQRLQYLGLRLGSGIHGQDYKKTYREYMEAKIALEHLVDLHIKQS